MEEAKVKAQTDKQYIMKTAKEILIERCDSTLTHYEELLKAFEEYADQFKPKWISSSERLPKEYGDYIIYGRYTKDCPKTVDCAYFSPKSRRFTQNGIISKDVTHWMELPKAPEV